MSETSPLLIGERQGALRYLDALRRHVGLIGLVCGIAVAAAVVSVATAPKRYDASSDLLVRPVSANDSTYQGFNSVFTQALDGSSVVVTAARVINSTEVRSPCLTTFGEAAQAVDISTQPLGQADIVSIRASAPRGQLAADAANRFASCVVANRTTAFHNELRARIDQLRRHIVAIPPSQRQGNYEYATLQQQLATFTSQLGGSNPTISVLTRASVPSSPSSPRPRRSAGASLLVALLVGVGVAILLEFATPRIAREEELQLQHRLPILARVPRLRRKVASGYLMGRSPLPPAAWKGYRILRAVLASAGKGGGFPRSILLTSAVPGDGKTTTAVNLAITLASSHTKVILVDGDLHRPMISSFFNIAAHRDGFSNVLAGRLAPEQAVVQAPEYPNLKLLLSSPESGNLAALTTDRFERLIRYLEEHADVVIVDVPPVPEVAEVLEMASVVELVLIAVHLGHTRRDKLAELRELLARRGITPAGFVVTTRERLRTETEYDYPGDALVVPGPAPRSLNGDARVRSRARKP